MGKIFLIGLTMLGMISPVAAYKGKLQCENINQTLSQLNDGRLRIFCEWAERTCQGESFLKNLPKEHPLRQDLEPKLRHDHSYNLELCELAIMHWDEDYYNKYLKR